MKTKDYTFIRRLTGTMAVFAAGGLCGYFITKADFFGTQADSTTVTVCHQEAGKNPRTMMISASALQSHLNHGDQIGRCYDRIPVEGVDLSK